MCEVLCNISLIWSALHFFFSGEGPVHDEQFERPQVNSLLPVGGRVTQSADFIYDVYRFLFLTLLWNFATSQTPFLLVANFLETSSSFWWLFVFIFGFSFQFATLSHRFMCTSFGFNVEIWDMSLAMLIYSGKQLWYIGASFDVSKSIREKVNKTNLVCN